MERTPAKRSSLFLLELMIAILFFCLASAVCVQIFVKAHTISRETQELNTALEKVSGYTELFLADALTEDTEVSSGMQSDSRTVCPARTAPKGCLK